MLSDRHPIKHLHIKAKEIQDFKGHRLLSDDRCNPDTVLSIPVQVTEDTNTLFDVLRYHRKTELQQMKEYTRHGLRGRANAIVIELKRLLVKENRLPNTGGNVRVVRILIEAKIFKLTIDPVDAGYLWSQLENPERRQCIREPYMDAATKAFADNALQTAIKQRAQAARTAHAVIHDEIDVSDTKYESCAMALKVTAETHERAGIPKGYMPQVGAEGFLKQMMEHFQIAVLHPWQIDLLKKFEASMNRYEALNFPYGRKDMTEAITAKKATEHTITFNVLFYKLIGAKCYNVPTGINMDAIAQITVKLSDADQYMHDYLLTNYADEVERLSRRPNSYKFTKLLVDAIASAPAHLTPAPLSWLHKSLIRTMLLQAKGKEITDIDLRDLWVSRINQNREADKNIGGNKINGMKAGYQIHDSADVMGAQCSGGPIDAMIEIDLTTIESRVAQKTLTLIGDPMKNIEDRVVIQGRDASQMSDDDILAVINSLEAQIKRYEEMPTKTKTVAKRVKDLKADLDKLVAYIDRNVKNDDASAES